MTDNFQKALEVVFKHEGVLADDENDAGGITKYGISLRWLHSIDELDIDGNGFIDADIDQNGIVDANDIRAMSREDAEEFYRFHWWDRYRYDELPCITAIKLFDLSVNMGATQAHKCIQRACRACGINLIDDGILGNKSINAIKAIDPNRLVVALRSEAAGYYRLIIRLKPSFEDYRNGWLARAYS